VTDFELWDLECDRQRVIEQSLMSHWTVTGHITAHFGVESSQAIDFTDTGNRTQNNKGKIQEKN